jgi:hypothetical protein
MKKKKEEEEQQREGQRDREGDICVLEVLEDTSSHYE